MINLKLNFLAGIVVGIGRLKKIENNVSRLNRLASVPRAFAIIITELHVAPTHLPKPSPPLNYPLLKINT